jgi:hypothetical protein
MILNNKLLALRERKRDLRERDGKTLAKVTKNYPEDASSEMSEGRKQNCMKPLLQMLNASFIKVCMTTLVHVFLQMIF